MQTDLQPHVGSGTLLPDRPMADVAIDHRPAAPAALAHDGALWCAAGRGRGRHAGAQRVAGVAGGIQPSERAGALDNPPDRVGVEPTGAEDAVAVDLAPARTT